MQRTTLMLRSVAVLELLCFEVFFPHRLTLETLGKEICFGLLGTTGRALAYVQNIVLGLWNLRGTFNR